MAYSDFSLDDLEQNFGITNRLAHLFSQLTPLASSDWLTKTLQMTSELPIRSEKAKSEMLVFPILAELRQRNQNFFTIYSGDTLTADENSGLKGECDFILAKDSGSFTLNYPIMQIVEAKRNDVELGIAQCGAQLIGAKMFNEKKGTSVPFLYGCVTTGDDWLFLKLEQQTLFIDSKKYYLVELGELLAIFQFIVDSYRNGV